MNDLVPKQTVRNRYNNIHSLSTLYWRYPYALGWFVHMDHLVQQVYIIWAIPICTCMVVHMDRLVQQFYIIWEIPICTWMVRCSHGPSGLAILHHIGNTHMYLDGCSHEPSGVTIFHYIGDTHLAQYNHLHGLRMVLANTSLFACGRSMIQSAKLQGTTNIGVCHTMALPFTLKSILRQKKKNYENSNISPCKKIY